jgi:hypothetical protein
MFDLDANATFARNRHHNLTGPLRHRRVSALAAHWLPEIRFHEAERFHPIAPATMFDAPTALLASLPEGARDALRLPRSTPTGEVRLDPPLVASGAGDVLASGATAREGLAAGAVSDEASYTHGANLSAATQIFGASTTLAGVPNPAPGDPRDPRFRPIVVGAEMRMLREALKHELELDEARPNVPDGGDLDALWGRFAVEDLFFRRTAPSNAPQPPPFSTADKRAILRRMVLALELADPQERDAELLAARALIPTGWEFVERSWNALLNYVFVEYSLFYAYNDYASYETLANEHEGDVEGFCLVFERAMLEELADGMRAVEDCVPHTVITSVHEELNDNDQLKRLPLDADRARDDLLLWVAVGSHATYLTPGPHDVVDFEDILTDYPGLLPGWALALIVLTGLSATALAALLVLALVEHFTDSEDQTSDNGIGTQGGPPEGPQDPDPGGLAVKKELDVIPLSNIDEGANQNIYNGDRARLALRAFPGKWGGHDTLVNHSAPWENKTARYFRNFIAYGDIRAEVIL